MQDNLRILQFIDLTSLNDTDSVETISALCHKAMTQTGHVAAVCVYPQFVSQAKKILDKTTVRIATVVNFPAGTETLAEVLASIKQAVADGANEIDMVFPYQAYLQGDKLSSYAFVRACKVACGEHVLLKVILETGVLSDPTAIAEVSYHVCHAGADFLKTSTGKVAAGATSEAVQAMLNVLHKIPRRIGLKVSGGVKTVEQAEHYIQLAEKTMGEHWLIPDHFRIGASQLVDNLLVRNLNK